MAERLIFEKSVEGRRAVTFPTEALEGFSVDQVLPKEFQREIPLPLPEVSENELMRHYTRLSQDNYGVDTGFYPLGSCTMKYNPKINEDVARFPGFSQVHPLQPREASQGALELIYELEQMLAEISGMAGISLQPAAGAQGELTGMLITRAYHQQQGRIRKKVVIPDSAHGTNPASAHLAGFTVQTVRSNRNGLLDVDDLAKVVDEDTAALMLTNPNTLGLFERQIEEIVRIVHDAGALMYLDGANLNALLGLTRPGDMGFDLVHFNLHKTFSTPHGGGGPGAGPVGVAAALIPYLPFPVIQKKEEGYLLESDRPQSIGRVHGFYGNFGILVRAYTYIRRLGAVGLSAVSRNAILNANYLKKKLEGDYPVPMNRSCMHEFIISAKVFREKGIHAWDIGKRLIDYGFYPPTVNFPLIVPEALMIEPTECESRETLDAFVAAMLEIRKEIDQTPEKLLEAPHHRTVGRMNEVQAAKQLNVRYESENNAVT
ncbi:MAG: aminomethyl-transferring glycine dehydrogenase subunit GcvPB [Nitrospira sp.]|nr:glycine dehydrogenase subunit 2 [Candidatus Manganitrophaceae bacterium]HIL33914.1 glycine dehydrogenase subunit 2 [Candidatus Manganitrophaceae bacterium]